MPTIEELPCNLALVRMYKKVFNTATANSFLPCFFCLHFLDLLSTYLCFELVVEVWVVEFHKTEEQSSFLGDGVLPRNLLLHVFLQKGHVAKEASSESPQQLEEQLNLCVVASVRGKRVE